MSLDWFSCGSSILAELEIEVLVFAETGKPENPEINPWSNARQEPATNSTHINGRQAFSPLCHLYSSTRVVGGRSGLLWVVLITMSVDVSVECQSTLDQYINRELVDSRSRVGR